MCDLGTGQGQSGRLPLLLLPNNSSKKSGVIMCRLAVAGDHDFIAEMAAEFNPFGNFVPVFLNMLHQNHPIGFGVGQDVELFIHEDGVGNPDGFAAIDWKMGGVADLHGIAVRKEARRQGVAQQLLEHVVQAALARGTKVLWSLTAQVENPAALGFFINNGFDLVGVAGNYPNGQVAVSLSRNLGQR